ncbi:LysR family transcriptional regulator [Terrilactibacillus sp. BCM23-1]|uniref:LysR family transcriptional regulator n=1 Tax=Terrilactibacillus tamarindi TaxID=2599694 RepID=A0A6N8CMD0_9BACI|nr:LysR family transcriptional regulator [Terrilactibacillus tamarindi]MTT30630.1 LysR family transcriptional regulator [Terrilactibacillus tamarindi]
MELLQLYYFKTVAQYEHITKAAKELSIAQPSLSQTISRLEKELGVPLFDRSGRKIKLNQYGRIFLHKVEQALLTLEEGKREINDMIHLEHTYITLAVMQTPIIPDLLREFRLDHPYVRFRVKQPSHHKTLEQLESGDIDLSISASTFKNPNIDWVKLLEDEIVLVVPIGHRLANHPYVKLNELNNEPFILRSHGVFRNLCDRFFRQANYLPDVAFEVDDPLSIRGLVKAGLGITFFSTLTLRTLKDPTLVPIRIDEPKCSRSIGLSWNKERYHSPIAITFRQFVIDYFSKLTSSKD